MQKVSRFSYSFCIFWISDILVHAQWWDTVPLTTVCCAFKWKILPDISAGRYKDAVEDLREAIRIDPSFEDAKIYLHQAIQDWNNTLENWIDLLC